jgi:hypothetical protein
MVYCGHPGWWSRMNFPKCIQCMSQIPFTLFIKIEQVRSFKMAGTELVCWGISVVCDWQMNAAQLLRTELLLTLRFVEYNSHARMNVLVWTKTISVRKCNVGLYRLFFCGFITLAISAAFLVLIAWILNFISSTAISGKFSSCPIPCSAFSRAVLFL